MIGLARALGPTGPPGHGVRPAGRCRRHARPASTWWCRAFRPAPVERFAGPGVGVVPARPPGRCGRLRLGRFDVVHVHEPFSPGLPYALLLAGGLPPIVATFHRSGGSIFYAILSPWPAAGPAGSPSGARSPRRPGRRPSTPWAGSTWCSSTASRSTGTGTPPLAHRPARPSSSSAGTRSARASASSSTPSPYCRGARSGGEGGAGGAGPLPVLWIAGNGPETEWLRRLHPESEHVRWLGVLTEEEKVRRLAAADVLCAPSLGGESFGMVLLEAMAARTLVVASDIDGYRDAVGGHAVAGPPRGRRRSPRRWAQRSPGCRTRRPRGRGVRTAARRRAERGRWSGWPCGTRRSTGTRWSERPP